MRIYNMNTGDMNKRFARALAAGIVVCIGLALIYGVVQRMLPVEFSLIYLGFGYCMGMAIRKIGRGVTQRFQVLAAVLAVVMIMLGDITSLYGVPNMLSALIHPSELGLGLWYLVMKYFSLNLNSILGLLFRAGAVYMAYVYAVIF